MSNTSLPRKEGCLNVVNLLPTNLDFMKEAVTHNFQRTQKLQPKFAIWDFFRLEIFWWTFFDRKILAGTFFRVDKKRILAFRSYVKQLYQFHLQA